MGLIVLDAIHLAKSLYQARFKVPALVTVDAFWDSVAVEPLSPGRGLARPSPPPGSWWGLLHRVYFVNASVITRTFSWPSLALVSRAW